MDIICKIDVMNQEPNRMLKENQKTRKAAVFGSLLDIIEYISDTRLLNFWILISI